MKAFIAKEYQQNVQSKPTLDRFVESAHEKENQANRTHECT